MFGQARVDVSRIPELIRSYGGQLKVSGGAAPVFTLKPRGSVMFEQEALLSAVKKLLIEIKMLSES